MTYGKLHRARFEEKEMLREGERCVWVPNSYDASTMFVWNCLDDFVLGCLKDFESRKLAAQSTNCTFVGRNRKELTASDHAWKN